MNFKKKWRYLILVLQLSNNVHKQRTCNNFNAVPTYVNNRKYCIIFCIWKYCNNHYYRTDRRSAQPCSCDVNYPPVGFLYTHRLVSVVLRGHEPSKRPVFVLELWVPFIVPHPSFRRMLQQPIIKSYYSCRSNTLFCVILKILGQMWRWPETWVLKIQKKLLP